MTKLQDDPKVQALVTKAVAGAIKLERKHALEVVKTHLDAAVASAKADGKYDHKSLKALAGSIRDELKGAPGTTPATAPLE